MPAFTLNLANLLPQLLNSFGVVLMLKSAAALRALEADFRSLVKLKPDAQAWADVEQVLIDFLLLEALLQLLQLVLSGCN